MATCPVCSAQISDDFGLIECTSCGAQLLVHMDGRVEYSDPKAVPEEEFNFGQPEVEIPEDPVAGDEPPPDAENSESVSQPEFGHTHMVEIPAQEPAPESIFEESNGPSDPLPPADAFSMDQANVPTEIYKAAADSPDLSDVADFGNSEESSGRDGSLRYNVIVTGIDTADVREAFREAITDRKLVWDIDEILRSLKNGEVTIENVTPPKAYMLISRLRNLPVQVRWEQYAISQT